MKKLLVLLALLTPLTAFAAGNFAGDTCIKLISDIKQHHNLTTLELTSGLETATSLICWYKAIAQNSHDDIPVKVKLTMTKSDGKVTVNWSPIAEENTQDGICTKLIPDITRNYDVTKLEWMRNGNPHVTQDLVSCNYRAEAPSMSGNLPVTVLVLLNTTNNRFTVEIR